MEKKLRHQAQTAHPSVCRHRRVSDVRSDGRTCRQDLEQGLLAERDESPLLRQLLVRLLQGCLPEYDVTAHNWQHYLRRLLRFKCLVGWRRHVPDFVVMRVVEGNI